MRRHTLVRAAAVGLAAASLSLGAGAGPARGHADDYVAFTITGSTQMQVLGQLLANRYSSEHPNVHITVNAASSADGFNQGCSGAAQLGMSDSYIQDSQLSSSPRCTDMIGIPVAVSATTVVYNIPGKSFNARKSSDSFTLAHPLRLSPKVLSDIYMGTVTTWNNREIRALNPGMKLPGDNIQAFNSSEAGGAGFVYSQWLALTVPEWNQTVGAASLLPNWPRGYSVGQLSTGAMVDAIKNTPNSIGFAGFDFAISNRLQAAALKNHSGVYLTPSLNGVSLAIDKALHLGFPSDFRKSFVNVPDPSPSQHAFNPACLEFFVVHTNLKAASPSAAAAPVNRAVKDFLAWSIDSARGQAYIEQIEFRKVGKAGQRELAHGFVPVPAELRGAIKSKVDAIIVG